MFKRVLATLLLVATVMTTVTGCSSTKEINELNNLQALNSEADVTENYKLSWTDEQEMIYSQVSDRTLLDLTTLTACNDDELQQVMNYMNSVDAQLCGTASGSSDIIDSCFTNYLLTEFSRTPYYWQRAKTTIRGVDPESRSIVVDVVYNTIDFEKNVQKRSSITLGEIGYEMMLDTRYERWLEVLEAKYSNYESLEWQTLYDSFVKAYGEPEDIFASQDLGTPTEEIFETGNQKTYEGLIDTAGEQSHATMTVRYILVPNYVLGINLGITCQHMYITDYKLLNDVTEGKELFTQEGYATVTDSVYDVLYSFFRCIDEAHHTGLYKNMSEYGKLDKFYEKLFEYAYTKNNNFTISLFDIQGTHVECGVTLATKVRAKGSNMTFPSYTDRYYVELELINGVLQIENIILLSRTIEGEPAITTDEADVSGFGAVIDLDNADRDDIEKLIANFSSLQLLGDSKSDDFSNVVDVSMPQSDLKVLEENMLSIGGAQKVVWLVNYQQGTSNYASVKCKELFQLVDNSIVEVSAVYDFIMKGNRWYVYGYSINSMVRLDTTNLATTGSLCLVEPGKVVSNTSQIKGTTNLDSVSGVDKTYEHKSYIPTMKSGSQEQGLSTDQFETLTELDRTDALKLMIETSGSKISYDEYLALNDTLNNLIAASGETGIPKLDVKLEEVTSVYYNYVNNRYVGDEINQAVQPLIASRDVVISIWSGLLTDESSQEDKDTIKSACQILEDCVGYMERASR